MEYLRKRRRVLCCGGCRVATVVIVGLVILALALTVFKVKYPRITMNSVLLTALSAGPGAGLTDPVAANATLTADVSIKNPNIASLGFPRSETDVYYKGQTVSVAYAASGGVGADGTVHMNVTLDLLGDRVAQVLNSTGREYDLNTYTEINGKVNVLGIYKKDLEIWMNYSIVVEVGGAASVLVSPGPRLAWRVRG